ncbi:hypothetical protein LCGC14_2339450, partial [marine sediment metagenome]
MLKFVESQKIILNIMILLFSKYNDITLLNSLDHIFITPERKKFGSKLF